MSVVLGVQLVAVSTEGWIAPICLVGFSFGIAAVGAGLAEETIGAAAECAGGLIAAAEVGTASLVEGTALLTGATSVDLGGAGAYTLSGADDTVGPVLLDERVVVGKTALLVSAGLLLGTVVGLAAGVELGFSVAVLVGAGSEASFLTGIMFRFNDRSAWVTSKAASC